MSEDVIKLVLPQHLRVAGEAIEGEVDLNFRLLQHHAYDEVQVSLRAAVFTCVDFCSPISCLDLPEMCLEKSRVR